MLEFPRSLLVNPYPCFFLWTRGDLVVFVCSRFRCRFLLPAADKGEVRRAADLCISARRWRGWLFRAVSFYGPSHLCCLCVPSYFCVLVLAL